MVAHEDGDRRFCPHLDDRDRAVTVERAGRILGLAERMCFGRRDDFTAPFESPDGATVMVSGPVESKGWMHARAARSEAVNGPSWPLPTHAVTVGTDQAEARHRRAERERGVLLSVPAYQPWGLRSSAALAPEGHQWEFATIATITSDRRNGGRAVSAIERRSPWEVPGGCA